MWVAVARMGWIAARFKVVSKGSFTTCIGVRSAVNHFPKTCHGWSTSIMTYSSININAYLEEAEERRIVQRPLRGIFDIPLLERQ